MKLALLESGRSEEDRANFIFEKNDIKTTK